MMNYLEVKSYAKINLGLQVLNKREDGFHNINTVFAKIDLHDKLTFRLNDSGNINFKSNYEIPESVNLILLITKLIKNNYNIGNYGIDISLEKNIPIGGGLGGGSSNAAATIITLDDIFGLNISKNEMIKIATEYGSDIPFFLNEGWAVGKSKGENLEYFQFDKKWHILVVNPNIHISTPSAYKSLNRSSQLLDEIDFKHHLLSGEIDKLKEYLINDFEENAFSLEPILKEIKNQLYEFGAFFALMSGSGASLFGFFHDLESASRAKNNFKQYFTYLGKII